MARWRFTDILSDVKTISNVTDQDAMLKRAIQMAIDRVCSRWDWTFLMEWTFFTTVAPYETGTVSINAGDTAVTGVSTVFTAAMVGRKIRFGSEQAYYTIASRSADTAIVLDQPYQGSSNLSGSTYSIYQDEYRLAADMDHYKIMRNIEDGTAMVDVNPSNFDIWLPTPTGQAPPTISVPIGSKLTTYSTGTVSATANTKVITGSSTAWTDVQGLGRGSRITVGTAVYTIQSRDSAIQLTVYETVTPAIAAATSYSILLDNPLVQLYTIPDAADNIYYRYQRLPFPLVDDEEIPDIPDDYHWLLIEGALIWAFSHKGDLTRVQLHEATFEAGIQNMIKKHGYPAGNRIGRRRSLDSISRIPRGVYPPEYDVKWSR